MPSPVGICYQPLTQPSTNIRVIDLEAGNGPLVCWLREVKVQKKVYVALSYCWTTSTREPEIVYVNGQAVTKGITASLVDALKQLRKRAPITVWADAICINQNDDDEKTQQVKLMRDIYASSIETYVWLGDANTLTEGAFAIARDAAQRAKASESEESENTGPATSDMQVVITKSFFALHNILRRPWFWRIWIVQEISVSLEVRVACGDFEIDFDQLAYANMNHDLLASQPLQRLMVQRDVYRNGKGEHLVTCLARNRATLCTDQRDKVFAMLGLVSPELRYGIEPDYTKTVEEVLVDTTIRAIQTRSDLDILSLSSGNDNVLIGRPSWVINASFSMADDVMEFEVFAWRGRLWTQMSLPNFSASCSTMAKPILDTNRQTLKLKGIVFDAIEEAGFLRKGYFQDWNWSNAIERWCEIINSFVCYVNWRRVARIEEHHATYHLTGRSRREAFWQTCYGGVTQENFESLGAAFERFDHSIRHMWRLPTFLCETKIIYHLLLLWYLLRITLAWLFGSTDWGSFDFVNNSSAVFNCRMFRTRTGAVGMGPKTLQAGDVAVILEGGKVPFILRSTGTEHYRLIGEAYVHGIMYGEKFDRSTCEVITLV